MVAWARRLLAECLFLTLAALPLETHGAALPASINSAGNTFRFVAWSDTKSGTAILSSLSNQAVSFNPALTIYAGDLENAGFTSTGMDAWKAAINGSANNGMFDKTLPVRGNHDSSNAAGWQSYFDMQGAALRVGASNFNSLAADLTYSFDYANSHFVGIDVLGDATLLTSSQIQWLDSDLSAAEARGLTHAFIYFHGPIYCVDGHCPYTTRVAPTPAIIASLIAVLNNHPIVSATFHGHEHVQAYVHVDNTRIPEATRPFEQFVSGAAGATVYDCTKTNRFDWCLAVQAFAVIDVSGPSFTVSFYQQGSGTPQATYTFTKVKKRRGQVTSE